MAQGVNITIEDGRLGAVPVSTDEINVVIGCSSQGPTQQMYPTRSKKKLIETFGDGPGVEAGAYDLDSGAPIIYIRTPNTNAGTNSDVDDTGAVGTSVVTLTGVPYDSFDGIVLVTTGGTIATAGIKFKYSLDEGRTYSPEVALGVAVTYAIPRSGLTLNFAAGTLVAADKFTFSTEEPKWSTADLLAAYDVLAASTQEWGFAQVVGKASASEATSVDGYMTSAEAQYRYAFTILEARDINDAESEATWLASLISDYNSFASVRVAVAAGHCLIASPVSGRLYRRPAAWLAARRAKRAAVHVDLARVKDNNLTAAKFGNPEDGDTRIYHDNRVTPGLDAARFITLTTHIGKQGLFITNANMMAPSGSDFRWIQFRRVMDVACRTVRRSMLEQLSNNVRLNKTTGFILEKDAKDIESGLNASLSDTILSKGSATDATGILSRENNILSTDTLDVDVNVIPLGYLKTINVTIGFLNPVRQAAAA